MDSIRSLKVCCGIWHHDVSSRSFKSCKLRGGASVDQNCLSSTPPGCSILLTSGEFGGQVDKSNSLLCSSNHSWTIFALRHYTAERGHSHQGILFPWKILTTADREHPTGAAVLEMLWPGHLAITMCPLSNLHKSLHLPIFPASNTSTLTSTRSDAA